MSHSRARATRMPESPAASVRASHVALMPSPSQLLDLLPPAGAWTTEDYLWLTRDTNQLIELADGRLETLPMPSSLMRAWWPRRRSTPSAHLTLAMPWQQLPNLIPIC